MIEMVRIAKKGNSSTIALIVELFPFLHFDAIRTIFRLSSINYLVWLY